MDWRASNPQPGSDRPTRLICAAGGSARQGVTYARFEVEHKSERQRRAIRQKAQAGKRHGGGRSFGYGRTIIETGNDGSEVRRATDIHAVNEPEAAAIRDAFQRVLRGESTTSIWMRWNREGLLTQHGNDWTGTTFRRMMTRPRSPVL